MNTIYALQNNIIQYKCYNIIYFINDNNNKNNDTWGSCHFWIS